MHFDEEGVGVEEISDDVEAVVVLVAELHEEGGSEVRIGTEGEGTGVAVCRILRWTRCFSKIPRTPSLVNGFGKTSFIPDE